jgi:hypothetical protein
MTDVWIRKHDAASADGQAAGWALWKRRNAQPWPHDEMEQGFRYYISEPAGKSREVRSVATVTAYLSFKLADSLHDAYRRIGPTLRAADYHMTLDYWLNDVYNIEKDGPGRWPQFFAFWIIDVTEIEPFWIEEIENFRLAGQTGWQRVPADRLPELLTP